MKRTPLSRSRKPPTRAVKARRAAKRVKKAALIVADGDAKNVVFERDKFRCVRCGRSQGIQWAHVITRADKKLRHLADNALTLCGGCHIFWWHKHPLEAVTWFQTTYPERYALLMEARKK